MHMQTALKESTVGNEPFKVVLKGWLEEIVGRSVNGQRESVKQAKSKTNSGKWEQMRSLTWKIRWDREKMDGTSRGDANGNNAKRLYGNGGKEVTEEKDEEEELSPNSIEVVILLYRSKMFCSFNYIKWSDIGRLNLCTVRNELWTFVLQ